MTRKTLAKVGRVVLTLPLYLLLGHIFMLGLEQFSQLHPKLDTLFSGVLFIVLPIVLIVLVAHIAFKCVIAFREGMTEENKTDPE